MKLSISQAVIGLLFLSITFASVESFWFCKVPPKPKFGTHDAKHIKLIEVGKSVFFSCSQRFKLKGNAKLTCVKKGFLKIRWDHPTPMCVPKITCRRLQKPNFGFFSLSDGQMVGSKATYSCLPGRLLVGDASRVCQSSGKWSGRDPICLRITCPGLSAPSSGALKFSDGRNVRSRASYSCQSGFVLRGNENRVCQSSGKWSGSDPQCKRITCPGLSAPSSGVLKFSNGQNVGSRATYSCQSGFVLRGNENRVCQSSGRWSGSDPQCQRITCPGLSAPSNGALKFSDGQNVGSRASYFCQSGFVLRGNENRICQSSGKWSGKDPQCQPAVMCPPLLAPSRGSLKLSDGRNVGSKVTYSCQSGFIIVGDDSRMCRSDGQWSGDDPACLRINCKVLKDLLFVQKVCH